MSASIDYRRYLHDADYAARHDGKLARTLKRDLLARNPDAARQLRWLRKRSDPELQQLEIALLERGVEQLRSSPSYATDTAAQRQAGNWQDRLTCLRAIEAFKPPPRIKRYRAANWPAKPAPAPSLLAAFTPAGLPEQPSSPETACTATAEASLPVPAAAAAAADVPASQPSNVLSFENWSATRCVPKAFGASSERRYIDHEFPKWIEP